MTTIVGISGSLRQGSYNSALLRAAVELVPLGTSIEIASIRDIPLYDADVESKQGVPHAVSALKDRIAAADGLLIVTPEYNNSMPGVLKNAIDWLSRPPADSARVFAGKPTAITGASPGRLGTVLSQTAWLPVLRALGVNTYAGSRLLVSGAGSAFADSGQLVDQKLRSELTKFLAGFSEFVRHINTR
jgi:chromate reductase, NAD(P)H dehydrogenase (quinone)